MIETGKKTSILISSQLPEFIRDDPDYANFIAFIEAYYEWMEQENGVLDRSKNILNYDDIDRTTNEFIDYYINDFLPNFPRDTLVDKKKLVKLARELYQSKGTPASYQFLFRVLYNSDFDVFYTKDAVLKASDGVWYVSKSLKLATTDSNFLNVNNYRIFGETSKSIATIENTVRSGKKIEVFISNIERLFQSGEFVRIVDNNNQDVLFNGKALRSKIVGTINQIKINPTNRGLLYEPGDPVVVYGGLNSNTGIGAIAEVGTTTSGSIDRINVVTGGVGYRPDPNTVINITNAPGAVAVVGSINPDKKLSANITFAPINSISLSRYTTVGNTRYSFLRNHTSANANTKLVDAFTFDSFTTYPISSIVVTNGGGGIKKTPIVSAQGIYEDELGNNVDISNLGILGPILCASAGTGYRANDKIVFSGGQGYGAYANVISVTSNGSISNVSYVYGPNLYPLGGLGYLNGNLPTLSVQSANVLASNASLYVSGILGTGATFSVVADRVGSVTTINVIDGGEDYIATPNVSLKVQDIVVSNTTIMNLPQKGDIVYQGANSNSTSYIATVNSISLLSPDNDPLKSLYNLRVFNYNSSPNPNLLLKIENKNINLLMANTAYNSDYNETGVRVYGDSTAKATATFLNGLVLGQGQYLNTKGQPSSFSVLQSENYNNYTYEITVEKEIAKYRESLLNLLHPSGTKILGRYAVRSNSSYQIQSSDALYKGLPLIDYTGYPGSSASMYADFTNKSNNIVKFNNLAGANIANFIFNNSIIQILTPNGPNVRCEVLTVDPIGNTVSLRNNTWLTFANVAVVTANSGSNMINIRTLTNSYNIINNGVYTDPTSPLRDIVYTGDKVSIANNTTKTVASVDYTHGIIYLTANLTSNANSFMSVNRTFGPTTCVTIFGPVGTEYIPELVTENGYNLTTEDDRIILLG